MAGVLLRRLSRVVRAAPGYPQVRRRVVLRLRASATARRAARQVYPDLHDERQRRREVKSAVRRAVAAEREAGAVALDRATAELRARYESELVALREQHRTELKEQRDQHKEHLRRLTVDAQRREDRQRRARPAVSAGDLVAGFYLGERPLLVFDVRGVPLTTAEAMLEEIAVEQVLGCGYRPMFLTDAADPPVWRRYGHLVEQVPPEDGWQGVEPYAEYLAQRLESIRADLGAGWYLPVEPTGLSETQRAFLRRCGR